MAEQKQTLTLKDLDVRVVGYHDISRIAGLVFLQRDFVAQVDALGIDVVLNEMGTVDLEADQAVTFTACFKNPRLREVVAQWWQVYDEERANGNIPAVGVPWEVLKNPEIPEYKDIIRLSSLVFLRRNFVAQADAMGVDAMIAEESIYGGLRSDHLATFTAAFHNPRLRAVVAKWWMVYDEERASGLIEPTSAPWSV